MPIAAIEARMAQIESTLSQLSPAGTQPSWAGAGAPGAARVSGSGGIIGSATGAVPGSTAEQATQQAAEAFSAQLRQALGASSPDAVAALPGTSLAGASLAGAGGAAGGAAGAATGVAGPAAVGNATGTAAGGSAFGDRIVSTAKQYLGVPYVWGGESPNGFDCSGLVQYVMDRLGVDMPRVARDQARVGTEIGSLAEARPGDLLGMRNGSHIAIYLGNNQILHAPQPGETVSIRSLQSWDDIDTIRRVAPAAQAAGGTRAAFELRAGA